MDFRLSACDAQAGRRPEPDEPDAQVIEDGPDDPMLMMTHMAPLHFGQIKGSTFPAFAGTGSNLLNKPRPVPPEYLFIPLGFEDAEIRTIKKFMVPLDTITLSRKSMKTEPLSPLNMPARARMFMPAEWKAVKTLLSV
jgi:hypothetical protein